MSESCLGFRNHVFFIGMVIIVFLPLLLGILRLFLDGQNSRLPHQPVQGVVKATLFCISTFTLLSATAPPSAKIAASIAAKLLRVLQMLC